MNHNCCEPDFSATGVLRLAAEHVADLRQEGLTALANDAQIILTAIETYIKHTEENK